MKISELKKDTKNYRKHNDDNLALIKKSINEFGFGRSIVIDNDNEIIAGNGVVSQLDSKTPIKVIETDGNTLIVVKRTDLKTTDIKRKKLAVMDNSSSDTSKFDMELLFMDFEEIEIKKMGIEINNENIKTELKEIEIKESYEVVCECENEEKQKKLFEKLQAEGIKCRILTL